MKSAALAPKGKPAVPHCPRAFGALAALLLCLAMASGCRTAKQEPAGALPLPTQYGEKKVNEMAKPRKVVIGTMCHAMWNKFPGLEARCKELGKLVDQMAEQAQQKYGRGLDLVVLTEFCLNDMSAKLPDRAVAIDSPAFDYFKAKARELKTYLIIGSIINDGHKLTNSALLLDRSGERVGRYDKVHVCPDEPPSETFEGGLAPGSAYPVFDCDFGRVGMQICFDYCFEEGWRRLARGGAEIVCWPSQSPSVAVASARAFNNRLYVVSSTWRNNASIIEPTGLVAAQIKPPDKVLVHQVDLEYRLLPWHGKLRNGEALREKYGDDVGFNYYPSEDFGIFWSNSPDLPIDAMVRWLGIWTHDEYVAAQLKRLEAFRKKSGK